MKSSITRIFLQHNFFCFTALLILLVLFPYNTALALVEQTNKTNLSKTLSTIYAVLHTDLDVMQQGEAHDPFSKDTIFASATFNDNVLVKANNLQKNILEKLEKNFLNNSKRMLEPYEYSNIYTYTFDNNTTPQDFFILTVYKDKNITEIFFINNTEFLLGVKSVVNKLFSGGTYEIISNNASSHQVYKNDNYLKLESGHTIFFEPFKSTAANDILLSFGIMIFILYLLVFTRTRITKAHIQKPIHRLTELITYANREHYDLKLYDNSYKEIDELTENIDTMFLRAENLQKENFQKDIRNIKSEIKVLHNQIQPHFILNTLNTIKLLGIKGEKEKLTDAIHELADLLQYGVYEPTRLANIEEEISMVKNYIAIMQKRFSKKIELAIDLPDSLKHRKMLKLLLQPIVENALKHSYSSNDVIKIKIIVHKSNENVEIIITDNGNGISKKQLIQIEDKLEHPEKEYKTGIGLPNTNQRIKMEHGSEYGLSIASTLNIGTTIKIQLPDVI